MDSSLLRLIDVSMNRASEGLRVVEDYVRFVLDDPHLTREAKQLRHDLRRVLASIPPVDRYAARDTLRDVGTSVTTGAEHQRDDLAEVCTASFQRIGQSLRCLEEYCKLIDGSLASEFETLRYRMYTLERSFGLVRHSRDTLETAKLYVLTDGRESLQAFSALVETLIEAGVHAIQLRDKAIDDRQLAERARRLTQLCRGGQTLAILNDRPDVAVLVGAAGIHVGQDELTLKDVRNIVGTRMLLGASTHALSQAQAAVLEGANYLGVGPVFPSKTKHFDRLMGLELVEQVAAEIRLPWFAIGGIDAGNVRDVVGAGATRVAVGRAVVDAPRPGDAALELRKCLESGV